MRFKPPPPNSSIGWRVEFRPMEVCPRFSSFPHFIPSPFPHWIGSFPSHFPTESLRIFVLMFNFQIQMTDFENAAFVVFIVLLTRVIISFKLNFLIPISKVEENMKEAQKRDAARKGMFYFRKDILTGQSLCLCCHFFQKFILTF